MNRPASEVLKQWLHTRLSTDQTSWLESQLKKITQSNSDRDLHITLGMIPRKLGRNDLALNIEELSQADHLQQGLNPRHWSVDTAARIAVVCYLAELHPERFDETVTDLCRNADLAESIALYSGMPLYPHSKALDDLIGEGLRTNIRPVFEAIAHYSPYPAIHFDQNRWNHMVLKALFIDSALAPIVGLDKRANAELARILCDYANERRAAGRPVTHELWRCVGPFATGTMIDDLEQTAHSQNNIEQRAALLALNDAPAAQSKVILASYPKIAKRIANGSLTWDSIEQQETTGKVA